MSKSDCQKLVELLKELNYTIASMESCTAGAFPCEITNIPGASAVLKESIITYSNEAKIKYGVPENIINEHGVYSLQTAIEMAKAIKINANSDIGVGITGQLGTVDPNSKCDKINHVWYAVVCPDGTINYEEIKVPEGDRDGQKNYVVERLVVLILESIS